MRITLSLFIILTLISCGGGGGSAPIEFGTGTATYRITISTSWSASTHPASFPSNPHFSSFIGVSAYNLMPAENWVESDTITLYTYDAGTDSGVNYTSANSDTNPKQEISKITDSPFLVNGNVVAVGEMEITRIK